MSGDAHLTAGSPCVDTGLSALVPPGIVLDLDGLPRFCGAVDMGAYELHPTAFATETVRLGAPPNPFAFKGGVTSKPIVGTTWDPFVDHATPLPGWPVGFVPDSIADFALITDQPLNLDLGLAETLLCDPTSALSILETAPSPGAPFALPVPPKCPLIGFGFCAQGGSIDSAF